TMFPGLVLSLQVRVSQSAWCALAFLCLAYFCHSAQSCPAFCKCYARRTEVVCHEVPLTEYPTEGLPKNTTSLTIQYTNITSISEEHLSATPLLQELHLYSNHLQQLSSNLLRGVPHLHTIDLTDNKLAHLPADVFSHAPLCSLVKIPQNLFQELTQVKVLGLDDNQLSHIPPGLLDQLNSLDDESLDLSANPWLCDGKVEYLWRWLQKNKKKQEWYTQQPQTAAAIQTTGHLFPLIHTHSSLPPWKTWKNKSQVQKYQSYPLICLYVCSLKTEILTSRLYNDKRWMKHLIFDNIFCA
uniref:LRRCT domain-containing protein n=1 Tax=Lates calcarifer TaxID=8187 RepID=A0A4W6F6G0_LATCA